MFSVDTRWTVGATTLENHTNASVFPLLRRIYVEQLVNRGGCFTLTQIYESGDRPLYPMDPTTNERESDQQKPSKR